MTNPYPLPRETRETSIIVGDGRSTYGPFGFRIWDTADVVATVDHGSGEFFTETVATAKVGGQVFDSFTVTFFPALASSQRALVQSRRLHERTTDVTRGGTISTSGLEAELSRQGTVLQELRRDNDRNADAVDVESGDRIAALAVEEQARLAGDAVLQAQLDAEATAREENLQLITEQADRASGSAGAAEQYADDSAASAADAAALVLAAEAGFIGFQDGQSYDFGFVIDAMTYFDRDFGNLPSV